MVPCHFVAAPPPHDLWHPLFSNASDSNDNVSVAGAYAPVVALRAVLRWTAGATNKAAVDFDRVWIAAFLESRTSTVHDCDANEKPTDAVADSEAGGLAVVGGAKGGAEGGADMTPLAAIAGVSESEVVQSPDTPSPAAADVSNVLDRGNGVIDMQGELGVDIKQPLAAQEEDGSRVAKGAEEVAAGEGAEKGVDHADLSPHPSDAQTVPDESPLHMPVQPGDILGCGRYRVIKFLGEGQSSRVWLAAVVDMTDDDDDDPAPDALVALKVYKGGALYADAAEYERMAIAYASGVGEERVAETSTIALAGSVVEVLDSFGEAIGEAARAQLEDDGADLDDERNWEHRVLAFRCLGQPLDAAIAATNFCGLNPRAARAFMRGVVAIATHLCDRGVIHTDIKPENLLLAHPQALTFAAVLDVLPPLCAPDGPESGPGRQDTPRSGRRSSTLSTSPRRVPAPPAHKSAGWSGPPIPLIPLPDGSAQVDPLRVVLIDFGLSYCEPPEARPRGAAPVALGPDGEDLLAACNYEAGVKIQTREYRAPEIILGRPFNTRTDVWSLGCLAYELVTGRYLFDPSLHGAAEDDEAADAVHLQLVTDLLGPPPPPQNGDPGVHEDMFFDPQTGRPLFQGSEGTTPRDIAAEVRPYLGPSQAAAFETFLRACVAWDPEQRASPQALAALPWLQQDDGWGTP